MFSDAFLRAEGRQGLGFPARKVQFCGPGLSVFCTCEKMPYLDLAAVMSKDLATQVTAFLQFWCHGLKIPIVLEKGAHARELS